MLETKTKVYNEVPVPEPGKYLFASGKSVMRNVNVLCSHSKCVAMCFVTLLHSLFVLPSCIELQEQQAIGGMG